MQAYYIIVQFKILSGFIVVKYYSITYTLTQLHIIFCRRAQWKYYVKYIIIIITRVKKLIIWYRQQATYTSTFRTKIKSNYKYEKAKIISMY